jgi:hypothetical protein
MISFYRPCPNSSELHSTQKLDGYAKFDHSTRHVSYLSMLYAAQFKVLMPLGGTKSLAFRERCSPNLRHNLYHLFSYHHMPWRRLTSFGNLTWGVYRDSRKVSKTLGSNVSGIIRNWWLSHTCYYYQAKLAYSAAWDIGGNHSKQGYKSHVC